MPVMLKVGVDNDGTNYGFIINDISLCDQMTRMMMRKKRIMMMMMMMIMTTQIMMIMITVFVRCLLLGRGSSVL